MAAYTSRETKPEKQVPWQAAGATGCRSLRGNSQALALELGELRVKMQFLEVKQD